MSEVFLDANPQICSSESDKISSGGTKHAAICLSSHGKGVNVCTVSRCLFYMSKPAFLEILDYFFSPRDIDTAGCHRVPSLDFSVAADLHESNSL